MGLAEELVFRGIVLRCLRTGNRPESTVALWTALAFGLFHLPNVFMGTGAAGLSQNSGSYGTDVGVFLGFALNFVVAVAWVGALVRSRRSDFTVTSGGVVPVPA